jgi:hypothetical protein
MVEEVALREQVAPQVDVGALGDGYAGVAEHLREDAAHLRVAVDPG